MKNKKVETKEVKMTAAEAQNILEKEKRENEVKCRAELTALLAKYNCEIQASMLVTSRGNIPQIILISK